MKFSHFSHIWAKPGMTPHQRYEQLWRELAVCDEVGFDHAFCVEHHFRPDESWMSSPSLYAVGAGARTKRLRIGPMGYIVPLYHPLRLAEEIAIVDQMLGGRMELGLVPGINPDYFRPFGLDYGAAQIADARNSSIICARRSARRSRSRSTARSSIPTAREISVQPAQRPHPPLWMMSRDPQTLEFCAQQRHQSRLFSGLSARRRRAALSQISGRLAARPAGRASRTSPIARSSMSTRPTSKAIETALFRASRAYEGFLAPPKPGETFEERARRATPKCSSAAASPARRRSCSNLFDADYLLKHDLVFIGSPETVAAKIRAAARSGCVQHVHGRVQFRRSAGGRADALDPPVRRKSDPGAARLRAVLKCRAVRYCALASSGCARSRAVLSTWMAKQTTAPAANGSADHM